jgi:hypothetical protein
LWKATNKWQARIYKLTTTLGWSILICKKEASSRKRRKSRKKKIKMMMMMVMVERKGHKNVHFHSSLPFYLTTWCLENELKNRWKKVGRRAGKGYGMNGKFWTLNFRKIITSSFNDTQFLFHIFYLQRKRFFIFEIHSPR